MKTKLLDLALIVVIVVFAIIIYRQVEEILLLPGKNEQKYLSEKPAPGGLSEPLKAAAEISQPREGSVSDAETGLPNFEMERAPAPEPTKSTAGEAESQEIHDLIRWVQKRGIKLVGIKKNARDLVFKGTEEEDFLPLADIPNLREVALGLDEIPDHLLAVMKGKTFYLSDQPGRGYTILGTWSEKSLLANIDRGAILEQRLTMRQTIHEFAHILDYHGIQGTYGDSNNFWPFLKELRDEIFAVPFAYDRKRRVLPAGYMDVYSTANPAENFAQHFMYYILYGDEFRKKAKNDVLLQKKYDFFKKEFFTHLEYGL